LPSSAQITTRKINLYAWQAGETCLSMSRQALHFPRSRNEIKEFQQADHTPAFTADWLIDQLVGAQLGGDLTAASRVQARLSL
jgi:hypothetical protein